MTFTAPSAADLLDGLVPLVTESFRWDVLDTNGNVLGALAVDMATPPRIVNDVGRPIRRTLEGLRVRPRPTHDQDTTRYYAADLNTLTMRVRPYMLVGAAATAYSCGIFSFADASSSIHTWGDTLECTLVDRCRDLDQPLETSVGYSVGTTITAALIARANAAGITDTTQIEASTATLAEPVAFAAGRDTHLRVMETLCTAAGFLPPYFNNNGTLVCRSAPNLASASPNFLYGTNTRVIMGSILQSNDLLDAPNRWIALDPAAVDTPIVGTFDIPDAAPNSFLNTGRRVIRVVEIPGLTDTTTAEAAAEAAYVTTGVTYSWLSFDTPPDPRHDTFDVIDFDGDLYLEQSWTLECVAGAAHRHECRGAYSS